MDRPVENANFKDHDVFHRKDIGESILSSIQNQNSHQGALTISIDAPWGLGKTTFMYMLRNLIKEKTYGWWTVYYDAWENDMTDDPFTSMLFQICGQCGRKARTEDDEISFTGFLNKIAKAASGILKMIPFPATQVASEGISIIQSLYDEGENKSITDEYIKFEEHKKTLHKSLSELAKACNKLIVFVDELDRCKPTFAVHVLEVIKHYFDIDNIVFIFGIDGIQLRETIKKHYGSGFDSSSYLTRFFDYQLLLPDPSLEETVEYCADISNLPSEIYDYLYSVFKYVSITPREVKSIINGITNVINRCLSSTDQADADIIHPAITITGWLLSLKCKKMQVFENVVHGTYSHKDTSTLESHLETLSNRCLSPVSSVRTRLPLNLHGDVFSYNGVDNALQKILSRFDGSMHIGDALIKLLSIVELPQDQDAN